MDSCEEPTTSGEVLEAMTDCGVGNAPGLDGLPNELYKGILDLFRHMLANI